MSASVFLFRLFPVFFLGVSGHEYIPLKYFHLHLQIQKRLGVPPSTVNRTWMTVSTWIISKAMSSGSRRKTLYLIWKLPAFTKFRNTLYMYNSFFISMRILAHKKIPQANYFKEVKWFWSSFGGERSQVGYRNCYCYILINPWNSILISFS